MPGSCTLQTQPCFFLGDNKATGNTSGGSGTLHCSIFISILRCVNNLCHPCATPTSHAEAWLSLYITNVINSRQHSMGLGPTNLMFLIISIVLWQPPPHTLGSHTPSTCKIMTTPPPHNAHTPITNMEDAEKRFHVPVSLSEVLGASNDVAGTWKCFSAPLMSA